MSSRSGSVLFTAGRTRKTLLCLVIAVLSLLSGCEPNRRYAILSFFFDGVPRPEVPPEDGRASPAGAGEAREKKKYYAHGPYGARLCGGCHERRTNRLIMPEKELCLFCHTLPEKYTHLHGPLAAGGCTVCHDPHGASDPALLVSDSGDFCLYCHVREDVMKRKVHQETRETCTGCHDAHGADNQFLLKRLIGGNKGSAGRRV